jgi:hypothetical protein
MNRHSAMLGLWLGLATAPLTLFAQNPRVPAETEFRVKLLSQISTETSRKGDKLTGQVISPEEFNNYFMEGQVRGSKSGKGKSALSFYFDTLETPDRSAKTHVQASIKYMVNSQGKSDVDEEGNVIKKTNNLGKAALATGIGALIGAAAGGGKGAAIGAGVGAAAALMFIEFHGESATRITFAPGSEFVMSVKER